LMKFLTTSNIVQCILSKVLLLVLMVMAAEDWLYWAGWILGEGGTHS
jgi:hypothetical protein